MTIVVAVADSPEGRAALGFAHAEAARLDTSLLVLNLALQPLDPALLAGRPDVTVVERHGRRDRDPVDAVLDEIAARDDVDRLVIGLKRRTPVGKLVLGSVSQGLLLRSPVPVIAVKAETS